MIFAWLNPEEPKSLGRSDLTKHASGPVLSAEDIHPPEKWRTNVPRFTGGESECMPPQNERACGDGPDAHSAAMHRVSEAGPSRPNHAFFMTSRIKDTNLSKRCNELKAQCPRVLVRGVDIGWRLHHANRAKVAFNQRIVPGCTVHPVGDLYDRPEDTHSFKTLIAGHPDVWR